MNIWWNKRLRTIIDWTYALDVQPKFAYYVRCLFSFQRHIQTQSNGSPAFPAGPDRIYTFFIRNSIDKIAQKRKEKHTIKSMFLKNGTWNSRNMHAIHLFQSKANKIAICFPLWWIFTIAYLMADRRTHSSDKSNSHIKWRNTIKYMHTLFIYENKRNNQIQIQSKWNKTYTHTQQICKSFLTKIVKCKMGMTVAQ